MKQLALPGLEHLAECVTPDAPLSPSADVDVPADLPFGPLEGQLALFDDDVQLRRDLHDAIERGEFERARELRSRLDESYDDTDTEPFAFLDELAGDLWQRPPREVLALALEIASEPFMPSSLAASVPRAVVVRLVATHGVETVLADAPDALPAVFNALSPPPLLDDEDIDAQADAAGRTPARRLVRDALLAGRDLEPLDFHDEAVRDLLAEDASPQWLACLGVVRRLWPVTPRADNDTAGDAQEDDDDAAQTGAFWRCLQVTEDHNAPQAAVHDARKRMKRLNSTLHAAYLKRLV